MSVTIKGLDNLNVKLDKLIDDSKVESILESACLMVERDAKILCPVDDGTLRNSITYEVEDNIGVVGTNIEYAPYVHQGTGIYAVEGNGRKTRWSYEDAEGNWHSTIGQKPQPFLEDALNKNRDEINKLFKGVCGDD